MKVLNLLTSGSFGGIEIYCKEIGINAGYQNAFCFMFGEGGVYDIMKKEELTVYSLSDYPRLSFKKLTALFKIASDYNIIVLHHRDPFLHFYFLLLKSYYPQKKFVRMIHSCFENYKYDDYGWLKILICNHLENSLMKKSDLIITVSNAVQKTYSAYFTIDEKKVATIYNGVGKSLLSAGKNAAIPQNECIHILYVGRLVREKGLYLLLEAFSKLNIDSDVWLQIVGDGEAREELEQYAKNLSLEHVIVFEGFRSNVEDYLSQCDIFVLPTLQEAFGISIVEAMAYGCICVANAVGGLPEIITDGVDGFLSEKADVDHLLKTLEKAINLVESKNDVKMRENAKKRAKEFSIQNTCEQLEQHFQRLLTD